MSFAAQPIGFTRGRAETPIASSIDVASSQRVAIAAEPGSRVDHCVLAVTATGTNGPSLVEVTMMLLHAGFRPIALTAVAGTIRATLPVEAEAAAIEALTVAIDHAASERQPARRRWFARA